MKCDYCNSTNVVYDSSLHAYVCKSCGVVLDDRPIEYVEKYPREDSVPRYSGFFTHRVHDHGVGGTEISGNLVRHIQEGRTWVARNADAKIERGEKKLVKALKELNSLAKELGAPSAVVETAGKILHRISEKLNVKEQTMRKIVAAALYIAYKKCGYPKPIKLFVNEVGISERDLWEGIKRLSELDTKLRVSAEQSEPRSYISYIVASLKLPSEAAVLANELVVKAREHPAISGKSPASLAAAAVYLASILMNCRKNQLDVGSVIGQTDVAIRNAYNALIKAVDVYVLM